MRGNKNDFLMTTPTGCTRNDIIQAGCLCSNSTFSTGTGTSGVLNCSNISTTKSCLKGIGSGRYIVNVHGVDRRCSSGRLIYSSDLADIYSLLNRGGNTVCRRKGRGSVNVSGYILRNSLFSISLTSSCSSTSST